MKVHFSDQVLTQTLDDEVVLLHLVTGRYFGLEPIGSRIWQLLGELGDTEAVLAQLLTEYQVDEARLRQDLDDLLASLIEAQLLATSDG